MRSRERILVKILQERSFEIVSDRPGLSGGEKKEEPGTGVLKVDPMILRPI